MSGSAFLWLFGSIIGGAVGLLFNIIGGGFIAAFLEMANDARQLKNKMNNASAGFSANKHGGRACFANSPWARQFLWWLTVAPR